MDLEEQAAGVRFERTMVHARRPARVRRAGELLAAAPLGVVAHDQVPGEEIHLLPVLVDERSGGERAWLDPQQPRAAAAAVRLVEGTREDLLLESGRIARRNRETGLEIDGRELEMLLVDCAHDHSFHPSVPGWIGLRQYCWASMPGL